MYALDLEDAARTKSPRMELIWTNPVPVDESAVGPEPFMVCRSRRHALNIVKLMDAGYIREVRRGDKLTFHVFEGTEPVPLRLIRGMRSAA